jgi:putative addiction module CopG family antidote
MKLELPPELEAVVEEAVKSGRYPTELDAARAAFALFKEHEATFQALKRDIEIGIASPHSPLPDDWADDVKRRGRERLAAERKAR